MTTKTARDAEYDLDKQRVDDYYLFGWVTPTTSGLLCPPQFQLRKDQDGVILKLPSGHGSLKACIVRSRCVRGDHLVFRAKYNGCVAYMMMTTMFSLLPPYLNTDSGHKRGL